MTLSQPYLFEITIQQRIDLTRSVWPVVVERSQPGSFLPVRSEATFTLNMTALQAAYNEGGARGYGEALGRGLFIGTTLRALDRALGESGHNIRILLTIEAKDLRHLHWERLCAPLDGDVWDFVARDRRIPFSFYLPSTTDQRFPAIGRRDLKALVIVANPSSPDFPQVTPFDVGRAIQSAVDGLGSITAKVLAFTSDAGVPAYLSEKIVGPPTLEEICCCLTDDYYSLLHIICHGWFNENTGETIIYLANTNNHVHPISAQTLIERLRKLKGPNGLPHFVFLATCVSGIPEAEVSTDGVGQRILVEQPSVLGGLAQQLVRELGMPAVLAMTDLVTVDTVFAVSRRFYSRLYEHGEVDRALVEACADLDPGESDFTVPAVFGRLGGRPLFTDALADRDLTNAEIEAALIKLTTLVAQRAEVLSSRLSNQVQIWQYAQPDVIGQAERTAAQAEIDTLCMRVLGISLADLAVKGDKAVSHYDPRCPFPGLYPFGSEDRAFFFGREKLVELLLPKLERPGLLAILGSSGSGKSSLVTAGLIPRLKDTYPYATTVYFRPGREPLGQLIQALQANAAAYYLVIDQFEEVFTLCDRKEQRQDFINQVVEMAAERRIIVTMRADFWGECAPYIKLVELMKADQELIAPLNHQELRNVIEQQARVVGLRFEAGLADILLSEVQGEPGAMPLIQQALLNLWKRRHGIWLSMAEYREMGGVTEAIACTADAFYNGLTDENDRRRIRNIFTRLARIDDELSQIEDHRDTRRRVALVEVISADDNIEKVKSLIAKLANERLVITSYNEAYQRDELEISHEALLRYWKNLKKWINDERVTLRLQEGVRQGTHEWLQHGGEESYLLHRGKRLDEVLELIITGELALNAAERRYINACRKLGSAPARITKSMRSTTEYNDLEIVLSPLGNSYGLSLRFRQSNIDVLRGPFSVALDYELMLALSNEPEAYGRALSQSLFTSTDALTAFSELRAATVGMGLTLRIRLILPPPLQALRWELLQDPRTHRALALDSHLLLSRYLSADDYRPVLLRPRGDLRALVAVAAPTDAQDYALAPIDAKTEAMRVTTALGDVSSSVIATTWETLSNSLRTGYDILYLVIHAAFYKDQPWLYLIDEHGNADRRRGSALADLLRSLGERRPQLVVLASYEGTSDSYADAMGALGPMLAQAGVPAVLVMQGQLSLATNERFVPVLFRELLHDGAIDRAVNSARISVGDRFDWWMPVLYSRIRNGFLWDD